MLIDIWSPTEKGLLDDVDVWTHKTYNSLKWEYLSFAATQRVYPRHQNTHTTAELREKERNARIVNRGTAGVEKRWVWHGNKKI